MAGPRRRLQRLLYHLCSTPHPNPPPQRQACAAAEATSDPVIDAQVTAMHAEPLFQPGFEFTDAMMEQMDIDGAPFPRPHPRAASEPLLGGRPQGTSRCRGC
eukprot:COSAG04_NODE_3941_length_2408_cov_1.926808_2_plen_102_part_00